MLDEGGGDMMVVGWGEERRARHDGIRAGGVDGTQGIMCG